MPSGDTATARTRDEKVRGAETFRKVRGMQIEFAVRGEHIQLDQLLKATGLVHSGGAAHAAVEAGQVSVDGAPEARKRAKLRPGQVVSFQGATIRLTDATA